MMIFSSQPGTRGLERGIAKRVRRGDQNKLGNSSGTRGAILDEIRWNGRAKRKRGKHLRACVRRETIDMQTFRVFKTWKV